MAYPGLGLLFDLGLILITATVFSYVARLVKQPPLLAYIVAGLFIGPFGLGAMNLSLGGIPIGVNASSDILILSELGVAFLLFSVGIETDLSKFRELGKLAVAGTVVQVLLTGLLVMLANLFLRVLSFEQSVYLGLIIAFSSTSIVVKILSDSHEINTLHGRLMIGFLLVQDLLAIIAMPFLGSIGSLLSPEIVLRLLAQIIVLLGVAYLLNRRIYPVLFEFASRSDELFFLSAMSSVFAFIFLSYLLNFPVAVGAFIAGVTISTLPYGLEVIRQVKGVRDFLATVFFVTLGIQLAPTLSGFPIGLAILLTAMVFVLKPAIFYLITLFSGYGNRTSLIVCLALAQVSEFSFIIANQGKATLEHTPGMYNFVILLIAVSMAVTPYFMAGSPRLHGFIAAKFSGAVQRIRNHKFFYRRIELLSRPPKNAHGHIVVFGCGTMGSNVVEALQMGRATALPKTGLAIVDSDPEVVSGLVARGMNAVYGSVENPEVWRKVGAEQSSLVIAATPIAKKSLALITRVKKHENSPLVIARAHYFRDALALYNAGADLVVMPHIAGSNLMVLKVSEFLKKRKISGLGTERELFIRYLKEKSKEERSRLID